MLTKMLAAIAMTGALWVAGDAAYQKFDCCSPQSACCSPVSECCVLAAKATKTDDCCSKGSSCCVADKSKGAAVSSSCCNAAYTYCTITGEVYEGCCCEIVDGQFYCLVTGILSDECCCIPLE